HPPWVRVQRMHTFRSGKAVDALVIDDLAGLIWAANLSTIELHPFLGTADDLEHPTMLVFDLDPGAPATIVDACDIALLVRDALARAWPDRVTNLMARHQRTGRVFIDWSQNDAGKSTVAPYSLRGGRIPTIAMPIAWTDIEHCATTRRHEHLVFTPAHTVSVV